jgi:Uncharacterised nucleotidyltransferase
MERGELMLTPLINALYDSNSNLPRKISYYHQAIEEIESSSISSQIYHLLKERGVLKKMPLFFQVRLKQQYDEALFKNVFIKSQLDQLLKKFEIGKVEVIPLKGISFAQDYFGHLGARGTSDIDILVRKESVEAAIDLVKSIGFKQEEEYIPGHFHCSFSKRIPGSRIPLVVEIHWDIVKESTSGVTMDSFWEEAADVDGSRYIKKLSHLHTFYMICLHGWRHNLDSPKYYIDIIQLIYKLKERLDYNKLFSMAKTHGTLKRLIRTLSIVYETYPMLERVLPLPARRISKAGLKSARYWNYIDYQFLSYDSFRHSIIEIMCWLFPRKTEILCELKDNEQNQSYWKSLLRLYRLRTEKMIRAAYLFVKDFNQA